IALAEQTASFGWVKSPISLTSLESYASVASSIVQTAGASIRELEIVLRNQRSLEESIKRENEVSALLGQLRLLVEAQVHTRAAERVQCQKIVATSTALLVGFDTAAFVESGVGQIDGKIALADKHAEIVDAKAVAQAALKKTQSEYTRFSRLREQSLALAQELREIAGRIIEESDSPDECPLCHTQFGEGKLAEHMNHGLDKHIEQTAQAILKRQRAEEAALSKIVSVEAVYTWLVKFCERASTPKNITVAKAVARLNEVRHTLNVSTQRLSILEREIVTLEKRGLSEERLNDIQSRLVALKRGVSPLTIEVVDEAVRKTKSETASLTRSLQAEIKTFRDRSGAVQKALSAEDQSLPALKAALSHFRDRIGITTSIVAKIRSFADEFPWGSKTALSELVVSANAVSSVAVSLQTSLGQERQDRKVHADLEKRRKQLTSQTNQHRARLKRLQRAFDTLSNLKKNHSLQDEMNAALLQNRKSIETIFSQIHSPVEFSGLSEKFPLLRRKDSDADAKLTEISTGQRAAYALSIFLAQNSQLTSAPPVMLIDDPIAHVDDLNALSFLDYLREVAVQGKRQIFFATASDKLATLIERKFDFLGSDFKKIALNRSI
ncbi:MAG: hypothetical protein Q8S20_06180, partial [Sulfuritalea sp.]|nr:hypothetical protein [Sulfuritalea sp.]